MFAETQTGAMSLAFPDVCNVPMAPAPVPTPFANIALSTTSVPNVTNIMISGGFAHNLLTEGTISNGDEGGASLGVASGTFIGPKSNLLGSFKTMMGPAFGARMTGMTMQNSTNMVGTEMTPAQVNTMLLS